MQNAVLHIRILQVWTVSPILQPHHGTVDQVRVQCLATRGGGILIVDLDELLREEMLVVLEPLRLDARDYLWK
jgi:hypothetical protein